MLKKTRLPTRRGLIVLSFSVVVALLFVELGTRVIFACKVHPRILLYGIRGGGSLYQVVNRGRLSVPDRWDLVVATEDADKDSRTTHAGTYSKYHPRQEMTLPHRGEQLPVRINNAGFRGQDVTRSKPDNVIRVLTLGASSTFGYGNRDDETYPYYLQQYLNERAAKAASRRSFEVLNLGIPHLDSSNIYALFMAEALGFAPDVVTFYEGFNDTRQLERNRVEVLALNLAELSLFLRFLQHAAAARLESFSAADVEAHSKGKAEAFVDNVSRIARACSEEGIVFVVVSQPAKSYRFSEEEIDQTTYGQEVEILRQELAHGQRVHLDGLQLLIHAEINEHLRQWAETSQTPLVDMIELMDAKKKRHTLASWVHLYPEGNRFLAAELGEAILALF